MFNLIQLILGAVISAFAGYYWFEWGQGTRTEFLPFWAQMSFRTLPSSDYIITTIGLALFFNGLLRSYRQYSARFIQVGPDPRDSLDHNVEQRRESQLRQHWAFKLLYYPLVSGLILAAAFGPFYKWSYLTSAVQEFFSYKVGGYSLGSPIWGIWIFSSWGVALVSVLSLIIRRRLSLKLGYFAIPFFLNWGLFYFSLRWDVYTHPQHLGPTLCLLGVGGLSLIAVIDALLMKREI